MGQTLSLCSILLCPQYVFKKDSLLYKGTNSSIYKLADRSIVCKVVNNYNMFKKEKHFICFMKQYSHENIIRFYAVVPNNNIFLMERADIDLLSWMKQNYKTYQYIFKLKILMGQMANGYRFLYEHHVEHYDIKPDNLLLTGNILKIADFGTCRINMSSYTLETGTFGFMAPEISGFTNKDYYVPHSMDVYSICLMFSYLLFAPIFKKFYRENWTLGHYLDLEDYINKKYPFSFLKGGLVVDQRYRIQVSELLDHIEKEALDIQKIIGAC